MYCIVDCRDEIVMIPSQRIIIYSTTKDWEAGQSRTPNLKFEIEMMFKKGGLVLFYDLVKEPKRCS